MAARGARTDVADQTGEDECAAARPEASVRGPEGGTRRGDAGGRGVADFILGPAVKALEEQIAAYVQCKYGIGVSSGTDALLLALMALRHRSRRRGRHEFVHVLRYRRHVSRVGARPDLPRHRSGQLQPGPGPGEGIPRAASASGAATASTTRRPAGRVRALMPVHLYGQSADMDPLMELAREVRTEGRSKTPRRRSAPNTRRGGGSAPSATSAASRSSPARTSAPSATPACARRMTPALASALRIMRVHGGQPKYYHEVVGGNFRHG